MAPEAVPAPLLFVAQKHLHDSGDMEKMGTIAALAALAQETRLDIFRMLVQAGSEGRAVGHIGERLGLPIDQQPEDRHAVTRKLGAFKTSMLQDVEANKPLEIDALVGAVRELGQITGTPTPHADALLGLVRLMARTRGLY